MEILRKILKNKMYIYIYLGECNRPLGMESGRILNSQLSASSSHDEESTGAQNSRFIRKCLRPSDFNFCGFYGLNCRYIFPQSILFHLFCRLIFIFSYLLSILHDFLIYLKWFVFDIR